MNTQPIALWTPHAPSLAPQALLPAAGMTKITMYGTKIMAYGKETCASGFVALLETVKKVSDLWGMLRPAFEISKFVVLSPLGKIVCLLAATMVLMKAAEYSTSYRYLSITCLVLGIACGIFAGFSIFNFNASFAPIS